MAEAMIKIYYSNLTHAGDKVNTLMLLVDDKNNNFLMQGATGFNRLSVNDYI